MNADEGPSSVSVPAKAGKSSSVTPKQGKNARKGKNGKNGKKKSASVLSNYHNLAVPVRRMDFVGQAEMERCDIPFYKVVGGVSSHVVSAGARYYNAGSTLASMHSANLKRVVGLWASDRTHKIVAKLNAGGVADPLKFRSVSPAEMSTIGFGTDLDPSDLKRNLALENHPFSLDNSPLDCIDALFCQDVYYIHPNLIKRLMRRFNTDTLIWLGHTFRGERGVVHAEGYWRREDVDGDERIAMWPDKNANSHPLHPTCDWMGEKNCQQLGRHWLVWSEFKSFTNQDYKAYIFQIRPSKCQTTRLARPLRATLDTGVPRFLLSGSIASKLMTRYAWLIRICTELKLISLETETVEVWLPLYHHLRSLFSPEKSRSTYTFSALSAQATSFLAKESYEAREYKVLQEFEPELAPKLVAQTIVLVFWQQLSELSLMQAVFLNWNWFDHQTAGDARGGKTTLGGYEFLSNGLSLVWENLWKFLGLAVIAWFMRKRIKRAMPTTTTAGWLFPGNLTNSGWFGIIAEELVKRLPYGTLAIVGAESFIHGSRGQILRYLPTALMHFATANTSLPLGIAIHFIWNYVVTRYGFIPGVVATSFLCMCGRRWFTQGDRSVVKTWKTEFYKTAWERRPMWTPENGNEGVFPYTPTESWFPRQLEPHCDRNELRTDLNFTVRRDLVEKYTIPQEYCVYLCPDVPLYVAGKSNRNLAAVISMRIMKKAVLHNDVQEARWQEIDVTTTTREWEPIVREEFADKWHKDLDGSMRKARAIRSEEALAQQAMTPKVAKAKSATLFVKKNEQLFRVNAQGRPQFKPRAITFTHPDPNTYLGPILTEVTKRIKEENGLDPPVFQKGGVEYRWTYASSFTDQLLSLWARLAFKWLASRKCKRAYWILTAGDDGLVMAIENGILKFYEYDFSMFDSTIGPGPLEAEYAVFRDYGMLPEDIAVLRAANGAAAKCEVGKLEANKGRRCSGCYDTTIGNGVVNKLVTVAVLLRAGIADAEQAFAYFGFKIVGHTFADLTECTFLKGAWWPLATPHRVRIPGTPWRELVYYWWGPLPSRVLKVGKYLGDPRTVKGYGKDLEQAVRKHAQDVASTYAHFIPVPVLEGYVEKHRPPPGTTPIQKAEPWRVTATGIGRSVHPHREGAIALVCRRYGVTRDSVIDLEHCYGSAPLFSMICHPLLRRMAVVDY